MSIGKLYGLLKPRSVLMTKRKKKTDDPITLGLIVMSATALAVVLVAVALAVLTGWL